MARELRGLSVGKRSHVTSGMNTDQLPEVESVTLKALAHVVDCTHCLCALVTKCTRQMVRGDGRVTYSRRQSYHTKSNKTKVVKTPGGRLVQHFRKKTAKGPRCMDTGVSLHGVSHLVELDL